MQIQEFEPFIGMHCETTATGSLLKQLGFSFSEAMLFGLGEGLGFIYWNMKLMDFPFIGGRIKPDALTMNLAEKLPVTIDVKETASLRKAWENVQMALDAGQPVGLKLDCYHLEYFSNRIHFAGHYVAMYGYDDHQAYVVDTLQQGSRQTTSLASLALARNEKGSMSSKNLSYTISHLDRPFALEAAIKSSLRHNAHDFLNPPIRNFGVKGIRKAADEIPKWFKRSQHIERDFTTTAMLMERAGTGGSLFRNLYRDFLAESNELLNDATTQAAHDLYAQSAVGWREVADLFDLAGRSAEIGHIQQASDKLRAIADLEEQAMNLLQAI